VAVLARGARVLLIEAPSDAAYRAALDRAEGPPTLIIHSAKERRTLTFGELIDRLLEADLVCVGEQHDSEPCHRVQLQIIKALHAADARLGVGLEMFQRPYQAALDRYIGGEIGEDELLKMTEYAKRWGYAWSLYQPIASFCKKNELPLAALNAPRELTAKVSKAGHAALSEVERKDLGPIDFHVKAHRDHWYEQLAKMHGKATVSDEQKERSYQVMTIWDEYMAASAAAFQQARQLRRMVVLAGSGHIDRGFGIPARATLRTGGRAATVHLAPGGDPARLFTDPVADYLVIIR
jgi:aminopeptidase N